MNTIFQFFFVISLILILIIALLIYFTSRKGAPFSLQAQARLQAAFHLKQLRSITGFRNLLIGHSYGYYNLDGSKSDIYEVELNSSTGVNSGYMIVSLNNNDFPLMEFSSKGLSLRARLERKIGHNNFKPIWLTPTFTIAIDENGRTIAKEGNYIRKEKSDVTKTLKREELYQRIIDQQKALMRRHKTLIKNAWSMIPYGTKLTPELVTDYPSGNFFEYFAEGVTRAPELTQIPPNTGENTKNFASGCGATAWAMLIAWHNLLWNPELLRGSQNINGEDWGPAGNPNTETAWNSYTDRVTMKIAEHLGTFNDDGEGATYDDDMERGFSFIKNRLNKSFSGKKIETNHSDAVQGVYDIMVFEKRPVVIETPGHYSVASGFLFNWDDQTSLDNQWLYIDTGWGYHKYLRSIYLDKYWYLRDIKTTQIQTYTEQSVTSPNMITTKDANGLYTKLWIFWRGADGKINYMFSNPGSLPDAANKVTMDIEAKYAPSLTTDGSRIIMAYVDDSDKIKLLISNPGKDWSPVKFPDIRTTVRPAISGWIANWLTVAFSDNENGVQLISTNVIDIDANDAWPSSLFSSSTNLGKYWTQLDFFNTNSPISMVQNQLLTYVAWNSSSRSSDFYIFRVAHKKGTPYYYMTKKLTECGANMANINNDVFLTYRGGDNRLIVDHIYPERNNNSEYEIITTQKAYLFGSSPHPPSLTIMERENGAHPVTIIGWTDMSNKINVRELSMDTEHHPMNYSSHPDF